MYTLFWTEKAFLIVNLLKLVYCQFFQQIITMKKIKINSYKS